VSKAYIHSHLSVTKRSEASFLVCLS